MSTNEKQKHELRGKLGSSLVRKAVLAVGLSAGMVGPAFAETRELIYDIMFPRNNPGVTKVLAPWAEDVEAASNGTLKLTIPTTGVAPVPKVWDAVQDGIADIAIVPLGFREKQVQLPSLVKLPFIAKGTTEAASTALWETHEAFFAEADEYKGFVPLTLFVLSGAHIFSVDRQISSVEDLDGLKFRAEGKSGVALVNSWGGAPVGAPGMKTLELLSSGVVDVSANPLGPAMAIGLLGNVNEITTVEGGLFRAGYAIVINEDVFNDLTEEQQNALTSTAGVKLASKMGKNLDTMDIVATKKFKESGANMVPASEEFQAEIAKRAAFLEEAWLTSAEKRGIDAKAALDFFKQRSAPTQ